MPDVLRERLGEPAADGLAAYLDAREDVMTDSIVGAVTAALEPRFDAIDQRFDAIDKRLDAIDKRLDGVQEGLGDVEERLDRVEKRFDSIDRYFERFEARIDAKLARVVTMQVASITLFATVIGAGFVALLARL